MGLVEGARFGDLVVQRRVGRGGMGDVYLVRNEALDRLEALKVLRDDPDPSLVSRFRAEARIGGRLHHPGIVSVYDLMTVDGQLALRMEYVDGPDLRILVRQRGPLPPGEVAGIVADVGDALDAAHRAGVLHRDVKPANIILPSTGGPRHAVLGDFGIGLLEGSSRLTDAGLVGTAAYTAPERLSSGVGGASSDLYALACTAFEALAGCPPFVADTEPAVVLAHLEEEPPTPREHAPDLPKEVDEVFAKALAKDPAERPPTCGAFAWALTGALGDRDPEADGDGDNGDGPTDHDVVNLTRTITRVTSRLPAAASAHRTGLWRRAEQAPAEERRRAAEVLLVQVSPLVVEVTPGRTDTVDVRVHNEDRSPHEVDVRVHPSPGCGLAAGLVSSLQVPAHGFADATLTVDVQRASTSRPGRHPYHVTVSRVGDEAPADRCAGHVVVGVYDDMGVELHPQMSTTRSWRSPVEGALVLHNHGNRTVTIDAAVHHGSGLRRVLAPVRETVPPGQSTARRLYLVPNHSFWAGMPVHHQLWVQATTESGEQQGATATLVQRGRIPWWILTSAFSAVVLGVLVLGWMLTGQI